MSGLQQSRSFDEISLRFLLDETTHGQDDHGPCERADAAPERIQSGWRGSRIERDAVADLGQSIGPHAPASQLARNVRRNSDDVGKAWVQAPFQQGEETVRPFGLRVFEPEVARRQNRQPTRHVRRVRGNRGFVPMSVNQPDAETRQTAREPQQVVRGLDVPQGELECRNTESAGPFVQRIRLGGILDQTPDRGGKARVLRSLAGQSEDDLLGAVHAVALNQVQHTRGRDRGGELYHSRVVAKLGLAYQMTSRVRDTHTWS